MATKKIETGELEKREKTEQGSVSVYMRLYIQEVISTPYIVFTKAKTYDWLVTRIIKEITSQNIKENI